MKESDNLVRVESSTLKEFASDVFQSAGLDRSMSTQFSDALICASLRGIDTHGITRLQQYSNYLSTGRINSSPNIEIEDKSNSVAIVDADDGPGPCAAQRAMECAVSKAKRTGIGALTVRNSNHFGIASYYTLHAAKKDCIGLSMSHAGPRVAPYGGLEPFLGTNPVSYSVPSNHDFSITLDMSTSAASNAKIRQAKNRDDSIPSEWAIDAEGNPTSDPLSVNALQPFGGAKGYGLGLFIEIMSGALSGMDLAPNVNKLSNPDNDSEPMKIGHFVAAIHIDHFQDIDNFCSNVSTLINRVKNVESTGEEDEVRLPGEKAAQTASYRREKGIPLDPDEVEMLNKVGKNYSISPPI